MEIRLWRFQKYRDCRYTCNPHKFEIPALRFPCRVPVIPCKHLQCTCVPLIDVYLEEIQCSNRFSKMSSMFSRKLFFQFQIMSYLCSCSYQKGNAFEKVVDSVQLYLAEFKVEKEWSSRFSSQSSGSSFRDNRHCKFFVHERTFVVILVSTPVRPKF